MAAGGEGGAGPGVEGRVVLQEGGGEHDRVQGASPAAQDLPGRRGGTPDSFLAWRVRSETGRPRVVEGAGSAVDRDGGKGGWLMAAGD